MKTKILTDSTSYIDEKLRKDLNIEVLSLFVTFGEESIKELDIDNVDFFKRMEKEGIPISSQPSVGELTLSMKASLDQGYDVIGIFISSAMSGTYNIANLAKDMLKNDYPDRKITIIDSTCNAMQLGFAVLTGARLAQKNEVYEEIVSAVEANIKRSRFLFIPEDLKYLEKGGRIGKAGALFGNMLRITPILTIDDGVTSVYKKVRTKKRAIDEMISKMLEDHEKGHVQEIAIHHINCEDEALDLKHKIEALIDVDILISSIGPVIGLHVGPGAIGLVYYTEDII